MVDGKFGMKLLVVMGLEVGLELCPFPRRVWLAVNLASGNGNGFTASLAAALIVALFITVTLPDSKSLHLKNDFPLPLEKLPTDNADFIVEMVRFKNKCVF